MTPDELVKAFVQAMLSHAPAPAGTKAERRAERQQAATQQMPLGLSPEQVVDLIDKRVAHIIAQGDEAPAPTRDDLNRAMPGWLSPEEIERRQQRVPGTYRPDGDYRDGEVGSSMPWIAPR